MTRTLIPDTDWLDLVLAAKKSIFRLEQQPFYASDLDPQWWPDYEAWLKGTPRPINDDDHIWGDWIKTTRQLAAEGRPITRIRVIDDPPTNYQQWTIWTATHINNPNGEDIRYLNRQTAQESGLNRLGSDDWWLLDNNRLVVMRFDSDGERQHVHLETDGSTLDVARAWHEVAMRIGELATS